MNAVLKDWAGAMLGSVSTLTWAEHACLWCSSYVFCHHFCLHWDNELSWWPRYNRVLQTRTNSDKMTEMLVFIGCMFKNPLLDSQLGKPHFLGIINCTFLSFAVSMWIKILPDSNFKLQLRTAKLIIAICRWEWCSDSHQNSSKVFLLNT